MSQDRNAKIRAVIVDDVPETRENLRKLLYFESDIEIVGTASTGEEAVQVAKETQPDIILMDINMPGMDGITASQLIGRESPRTQIIMMSVQSEADYLRRSMMAGAREFLIKPFSSDELVSSIKRVYELSASRPQPVVAVSRQEVASGKARVVQPPTVEGKIISVFGPKGGVGTSTIAANLAIALHEESKEKVALIDGNLQFGGIDVLLNLQATRTIADLATKTDELDAELISSTMVPHASGIRVLLAPPRPEMADLVHAEQMKALLEQMRHMFRYTIVDTWASLQDLTLSIMDVADRVLLIATPEVPAIKNAKIFFDVAEALDYSQEKVLLVINQADRRGAIRLSDIESSIKHPVAAAMPVDERAVYMAANQGVPLMILHRNSPVSQSILQLARRLLTELEVSTPEEAAAAEAAIKGRTGLLGRLFG